MPRRILVVDDNEINRRVLSRILSNGYEVTEATNGQLALDILRKERSGISAVLLDLSMPVMDGYEVLRQVHEDNELSQIPIIVTTGNAETDAEVKALSLGANDYIIKPYNPAIIRHRLENTINLRETSALINAIQRDPLTGLYTREVFFQKASEMIAAHDIGYYTLTAFDIEGFKVINDRYGTEAGDRLLRSVGAISKEYFGSLGGISCRLSADNFAALYPDNQLGLDLPTILHGGKKPLDSIVSPITFSVGRYTVIDPSLPVSSMYDRAYIAKQSIKGRYDVHTADFDESMRDALLQGQEIVGEMHQALQNHQFEVWFQPQYNHSTGALIGAEALVRWRHPVKGLIPPNVFIPVFEQNGFIYEMDKYVWERVCVLLRKWINEKRSRLPVSVNISRYDILRSDLFDVITGLVRKYDLPIDLLRLEITESAFAKSSQLIIDVVKRLIDYGFTVEIDDFGSGYSSLNTLKDVPASILKLDMRFLEGTDNTQRGGNILESIVRMAKWLGMPVIAEGVETIQHADYLRSIGCVYLQGYLYAKPMPVGEYEELRAAAPKEEHMRKMETIETLDNNAFWDPASMDTLIFNSYVGGACIFELHHGKTELLRVNEKYARELIGGRTPFVTALSIDVTDYMDELNRAIVYNNIQRAVETGEESTCENEMRDLPNHPGITYVRTTVRMIAKAGERLLMYGSVLNITAQREAEIRERQTAEQLQAIINNINGGVSAIVIEESGTAKIVYANTMFYTLLGYTREQYTAEVPDSFALLLPEDRMRVREIVQRVLSGAKMDDYEYRAFKRDGSIISLRCGASVTSLKGVAERTLLSVISDASDFAIAE